MQLTSLKSKYTRKRTIKTRYSSLLQFKMAAFIRMFNEFPPKFAHHVTFYTATKAFDFQASRQFFSARLPDRLPWRWVTVTGYRSAEDGFFLIV